MFPWSSLKTPNPYFEYELRRIRWASSRQVVITYTAVVLIISLLIGALLVFRPNAKIFYSTYIISSGIRIALWVGGLIADLYYIVMPMLTMSRAITSGQWDTLRITPLGEDRLLRAKHALAQTRSWRVMVLIIGADMISAAFNPINTFSAYDPSGSHPSQTIVLAALLAQILQVSFMTLFRMRALTAIGLQMGVQIRSITNGFISAFLLLLGLGIVQGFISGILTFIATVPFYQTAAGPVNAENSFSSYLMLTSISGLGAGVVMCLLYWVLQRRSFGRTLQASRSIDWR